MSDYGRFDIFAELELHGHLDALIHDLKRRIGAESSEYLLNVNEADYIASIVASYQLDSLALHFDKVSVSAREEMMSAERFPGGGFDFNVLSGRRYPKHVITYHVPFSGDAALLRMIPSSRILWTSKVYIAEGCVCFDTVNFYDDAQRVMSEADNILKNMGQQLNNVNDEVRRYNDSLPQVTTEAVSRRRQELGKRTGVLTALGVPIRKSASIPHTFAVPTVRKKVISRPPAVETKSGPVPTLDEAIYDEILQTIFDMGKVFERLPSTYGSKDEEALRDHLVLQLEPRFEGSTTGETFNKTGKTDILIRYDKNNVFVAECKFWDGKAHHVKAIDQILSYLTWRDSKTAIVYFVRRKDISPVLKEIAEETPKHANFVRRIGEKHPSWQMFELHLPGDEGCKIRLTILAFHTPVA